MRALPTHNDLRMDDLARQATLSLRALRIRDEGAMLKTSEVVALIHYGCWGRLGFALLMALVGSTVLALSFTITWGAFMALWEFLLRPALDRLAIRLAVRSERRGVQALALINCIGGCAYGLFPLLAWDTQTAIGMVLATGWVCGSARMRSCISPAIACCSPAC